MRRIRDDEIAWSGKKSKKVFWEEPKEQRKETRSYRGYLPKVLASYIERYQANGIFRAFLGIQYHSNPRSEIKINILITHNPDHQMILIV